MVDVLVAGAGPAGAVAAIRLARAGARVLLVDRARFPRDKLCGDTLNPGALRLLDGLGLRAAIEALSRPLDGMLVTSGSGVAVRGTYGPGIWARALTRRELDARLVEAAAQAGVQVEEGVRVEGALLDTGGPPRVRGVVVQGRGRRGLRLPATVTIAADGRRSTLAFGLGLAWQPRGPRRWAIGGYYEGIDGLQPLGEMHIRGGHYFGIAPLSPGLANVCLVSPAGPGFGQPQALLADGLARDPVIAPRLARARLVSPVTTLGPLAVEARAAGMPGLLLAGDAAGFVDPMTGDGLRLAMHGALLAAEVALAWLDDPALDAPARLADLRRRAFGRKLGINRMLRRLVASARAVRLASAGARVAPGLLRRVIRYAGDAA